MRQCQSHRLLTLTALCIAATVAGCGQPTAEDVAAKPWLDRLEHFRPETRAEAIKKLAGLKYRPAARRIAKRINDVRPDVRLDAIKALGELADPGTVAALRQALSEPEWVHRKEAVVSLAKIRHDSAVPVLIRALADTDQAVGRAAAVAIASFGTAAEDKLIEMLSTGPMAARPNAATALGVMKSTRAREPLCRALAVSNTALRVSVTIAIASYADAHDLDLLSGLLGDSDPSVSRATVDSLARMGATAVPAVLRAATNSNRQARLNAYRILLDHPREPGVLPVLLAGLDVREGTVSSLIRDKFFAHGQPRTALVTGLKKQIVECLGNPSDSVRMRALDLLEPVADSNDVEVIAGLLDDPGDSLKRRAAGILAGMRNERSRQALHRLAASTSEDMRFIATTAMASHGDDESVTKLIALLESLNPPPAGPPQAENALPRDGVSAARADAAVAALGLSRDRRAIPVLARMLAKVNHPTAFLRLCQALSDMEIPEAFQALAGAADNANWHFREGRSAALNGLARSDPKRAVDEYAKHLTSTTVYQENHHREAMLQELGRIADPRGVPCMVPHLVHDNEEVRRVATQALIDMKGAAVDGLITAASTTNRTLRAAIAFTLAQIGTPAVASVNAAMNSHAPEVREVAAWTVGQMSDPAGGIGAAKERLNIDPSPEVRAACAWAIGKAKTTDEGTLTALAAMLRKDAAAACRHTAAFALGEIAPTSAVPHLVDALTDEDNGVRAVAAGALGRIAAPEVLDPLRRAAASDKSPEVRSAARNALIAMGQAAAEKTGEPAQ